LSYRNLDKLKSTKITTDKIHQYSNTVATAVLAALVLSKVARRCGVN